MRDINETLELWGAWAANDHSQVDWQPIAAGFKGLLPYTNKSRQQCSDDEGMLIDACVGKLKKYKNEEFELVVSHYVFGISLRALAKKCKCSDGTIRKMMQLAHGFIEGLIVMEGINQLS